MMQSVYSSKSTTLNVRQDYNMILQIVPEYGISNLSVVEGVFLLAPGAVVPPPSLLYSGSGTKNTKIIFAVRSITTRGSYG